VESEEVEVTFKYVIGSYWIDTSKTTFSTDTQYQISPIFVVQYRSYPGGLMRLSIMFCAEGCTKMFPLKMYGKS